MNSPESGTWQLIAEESGFRDLETDWDQLFAANPKHRPFQAWSWVTAWLKHLAGSHTLHVICLRGDDGQLQFVLPLIRSTGNGRYRSPRLISMCGYGPECSDHVGPLRLPSLDSQAARLAATGLARMCGEADRIELDSMDGLDDFALILGSELEKSNRTIRTTEFAVCPAVNLPESWEAYLQILSSNFRSQVRRYSKRIAGHDTMRFRSVEPSDANAFTRELIRLNRSRMGVKGNVSSLEDPKFRDFLLEAVPGMARAGLAWMDVLEDNGNVVGAALNLVHGESVYYYMGGFDESSKDLRPGTALFARLIAHSIENGYRCYDFLRGAEKYKYRWGATDRSTYQLVVYPRGIIRGQLACKFDGLCNWVRNRIRRIRRRGSVE